MVQVPGAETGAPPDRYAVLGYPVAHSRSPFIHAQFARQTGQHLVYDKLLCAPDNFAAMVRQFAADGGKGCNITLPFKFEVPTLASRCTPRATLAGAANTLAFNRSDWLADNTDGVGLVEDIANGAGRPLQGQRILIIGAGGAAAGVLGPLLAGRPARVVVANRTLDKAQSLANRHQAWAFEHRAGLQACSLAQAAEAGGGFDIVINASASSLQGSATPVSSAVLAPGCLAVDLMYGAAAQPWLDWAASHGALARDGLGMLVEQAAAAFSLWRGVRPATAPVLQALRQQLQAEGAGRPGA